MARPKRRPCPAIFGSTRAPPQAVATAKYTLRALRPGYLYTYDEKRKKLAAYMVLDDGIMWNFPPGRDAAAR
ncbi:toxin VasX [Burkholderia vietnamiensis]|uniref:toxin VasX n=1 Tax=Burkholderia vietnamiensis TaxID=60552 RepID=UPI0032208AFF